MTIITDGLITIPEASQPKLSLGLLGVEVPEAWGGTLDSAKMNYMRDMRLLEIERRILALESALAAAARSGETTEELARSEGPQSGGDEPQRPDTVVEQVKRERGVA